MPKIKVDVKYPNNQYHYHYHHNNHHRINKLLFAIGTDFIMHNTSLFSNTNSPIADFFWNVANDSVFFWLVSEPNSTYRIRQAAASFVHFHRFMSTSFVSAADYSLSYLIGNIIDVPTFSEDNSKLRAFRRLMLTLHRNGGVYQDLYDIIENMISFSPSTASCKYQDTLNQRPFKNNDDQNYHKNWLITRKEAAEIILNELGIRISRQFFGFPLYPTGQFSQDQQRSTISYFNCRLSDGQRVTVAILPPHLERMRKYDLFPFKMIRKLIGLIPKTDSTGFEGGKKLFDAVISRIESSNNLVKEVESRRKILSAFGVDFSKSTPEIIEQAKNVDLPLYVAPPLVDMCTAHVMVTAAQHTTPVSESSARLTYNLTTFTTKLLQKTNCVVPNIGLSNIRTRSQNHNNDKTYSLMSYSSLIELDPLKVNAAGKLYSGLILGDKRKAREAATARNAFDVPRWKVDRILGTKNDNNINQESNTYARMTAELLPKSAEFVLAGSEVAAGLAKHAGRTTAQTVRSMVSAAEFVSSFINDFSFRFVE